jgi:hypothetical protein
MVNSTKFEKVMKHFNVLELDNRAFLNKRFSELVGATRLELSNFMNNQYKSVMYVGSPLS